MPSPRPRHVFSACVLALTIAFIPPIQAETPNDSVALQGLKTARVVWDVTTANPHTFNAHLTLVEQTWNDLMRQKVRPEMVFAFREGSVRMLSSDEHLLPFEQAAEAEEVRARLARMAAQPGVRMEACSISMRGHGVNPETLPTFVHIVGNTFNSMIGRAPKGFAVITLP